MPFATYRPETDRYCDEYFTTEGPRPELKALIHGLERLGGDELRRLQGAAETALMKMGITFTVYGDDQGTERIFPFDVLPRVIAAGDWQRTEAGLKQRVQALNLFIADVYGAQRCLKEGVIPRELVLANPAYRPQCQGLTPPLGVWAHICGTDLVRDQVGTTYVLEDNLRCPSGVSYVLENRELMQKSFPGLFAQIAVAPVDDYPARLLQTLAALAPAGIAEPTCVVLTPGIYNSAYYEHSFLAREMGIELVEGSDLVVEGGAVHIRTTEGLRRVDVIYRRIDDDFLDPRAFRPDSLLGVPGLMSVFQAGRVALANAPGTGVADDKAVYSYVPELIRFYLSEEPILANVPTWRCREPQHLAYVLEHLHELVVKAVDGAGGYGMLIGPHATAAERTAFAEKLRAKPIGYIAQPTLALSRVPTLIDGVIEGRHVDLRPYILTGRAVWVQPGGLSRVALRRGSLVVNSSQGGGSKDTWVLKA